MDGVWLPAGGENPGARGFPDSRHTPGPGIAKGEAFSPLARRRSPQVNKKPLSARRKRIKQNRKRSSQARLRANVGQHGPRYQRQKPRAPSGALGNSSDDRTVITPAMTKGHHPPSWSPHSRFRPKKRVSSSFIPGSHLVVVWVSPTER